eukprot:591624-Hanusia_phi.AAC.1
MGQQTCKDVVESYDDQEQHKKHNHPPHRPPHALAPSSLPACSLSGCQLVLERMGGLGQNHPGRPVDLDACDLTEHQDVVVLRHVQAISQQHFQVDSAVAVFVLAPPPHPRVCLLLRHLFPRQAAELSRSLAQ